jgi:hypothetical protein
MENTDPHDLVKPDSWFPDENAGLGYVHRLFIQEVNNAALKV